MARANTVDKALAKLVEPFLPTDLEWRINFDSVKHYNLDEVKPDQRVRCKVLTYITVRAVMTRLDEVFGPENWEDHYEIISVKTGKGVEVTGVRCTLRVRYPGTTEWVVKSDVAEPTQVEPLKGAFSDAMKRAAVKLGIGRYLYAFDDASWGEAMKTRSGKSFFLISRPAVPLWAYPPDYKGEQESGMVSIKYVDLNDQAPTLTGLHLGKETATERPPASEVAGKEEVAISQAASEPEEKKPAASTETAPVAASAPVEQKPAEKQVAAQAKPTTGTTRHTPTVQELTQVARAKVVPMGRGLPGEGKTFGQVMDESGNKVALHLFRILVNHESIKKMGLPEFVPANEEEQKLVKAATYLIDRIGKAESAAGR